MLWPCQVTARTRLPNGKTAVMQRRVEGAGDVVAAMRVALLTRKDAGKPFHGCEITAITPLGQVIKRTYRLNAVLISKEQRE